MPSLSYLLARLLQIVPTFLLVMVFIFLLVRLLPGDPGSSQSVRGEMLERIAQQQIGVAIHAVVVCGPGQLPLVPHCADAGGGQRKGGGKAKGHRERIQKAAGRGHLP